MIDIILPVFIITQDLLKLTEDAVKSIKETAPEHRLIIVDNGSPMAGGWLRSIADVYVLNKENKGYAIAMNQGFALSNSDFVVVTQNDTLLSPGWAETAFSILDDPTVGSVHFRMIPYGSPMEIGDKTFITGRERWCTAAFYVIRKEAIGKGYDLGFGIAGYEDWDFFYNMRKEGWKTAYTTKACYQHLDSSTQLKFDQSERRAKDVGRREHFKEKWGAYPEEALVKLYPEQMRMPYYEEFKKL